MPNWAGRFLAGSLIKGVFAGAILLAGSLGSVAFAQNPRVLIETSKGDIEVELFEKEAPVTVANFLSYVKKGHYDGTIFHRVISDFVVQGGGLTEDMKEKPTADPIENEAGNGLKNERMTLSMARTSAPHSATSQFYINLKYNRPLDRKYSQDNYGYCVFGKVVKGEEIVDQIAKVKTGRVKGSSDVPIEPITLKRAMILEGAAAAAGSDSDKKDK
ncbi:MAG: peptidyl-prolyl cis-trans isomerase [Planctomycetaceae bacterium]|jgi:cyclophilin family peptidyl-prolyl cis-trans isomerase|nr:peptidyl-prolyl cis-trans isomerase [Planctomycetaceae bacterium]MCE2813953.1 peptidyl-prolyl cis-trans isomerase [Planctomycetaceae bacterium]